MNTLERAVLAVIDQHDSSLQFDVAVRLLARTLGATHPRIARYLMIEAVQRIKELVPMHRDIRHGVVRL